MPSHKTSSAPRPIPVQPPKPGRQEKIVHQGKQSTKNTSAQKGWSESKF